MWTDESYRQELVSILQQRKLQPLFQPVLDFNSGLIQGYEALIRGPSDSPLHSPLVLFKVAHQCQLLAELEMLCRELSIAAFAAAGVQGDLYLNVNPLLLLSNDHPSGLTLALLEKYQLNPSRVVIELSEQYQVDDSTVLINAVHHYRELGFRIAIDDLGSGFSGLKLWSELKPDLIKIDRYFISQVHADPTKKEFVRSIIALAKSTGSAVVAEGIETREELLLCQELGADYGQGYLLGRPNAVMSAVVTGSYQLNPNQGTTPPNSTEQVGALLLSVPAVSCITTVAQLFDLFSKNPQWSSLAIVEDDQPVGIVQKSVLFELFSSPYGRALYEKKPVKALMDQEVVIVDEHCSLDQLSQQVTDQDDEGSWYFIVTRENKYLGLGSVRALLKRITESKLQNARYANPLTLLPGNVPIYREIDGLLQRRKSFHIAYFDLNDFKPYNDTYGYSKGDLVIQLVAELLTSIAGADGHFVGHVGGDDFVVIFTNKNWQQLCQQVLNEFAERVLFYYESVHVRSGGISSQNRSGEQVFYPLLSLAVGVVSPDPRLCVCHHDVAALASDAKTQAKKPQGNFLFVSRRRGPGQNQIINEMTG
jgi:diguanylate cyclase (GGDEF)-like protein